MDIVKVVDWVSQGRLDHIIQNNEPTGQEKMRKVCTHVCARERVCFRLFVGICVFEYVPDCA